MFQIGEEDFSFGDDEDFWSEALEMEEEISASSSCKPVSTIRTTGSSVSQSHLQQTNQGSPATENALGPSSRDPSVPTASVGNTSSRETACKTLQDTNKQIPQLATSTPQLKRKFAFKQKSPRGGTGSNILSATNQAAINVNKRAKQDNQVHSSFSNSNLAIQNEKSPDLSKNIQTPNQSISSLRAPANQVSGALRPKQQFSNPANVSQKQGQQTKGEITAPFQHGTNSNLPHKIGQSTSRDGQDKSSGQNPATGSTKLSVQGQHSDSTAGKGLSFEVGYNLEEEFNLSQDNFDWDPVTAPYSTIVTSTVTQSVSALRSCNQLNRVEVHKSSNNSKSNSGLTSSGSSMVGGMPGYSTSKLSVQSYEPNPPGTANQQKSNLIQGGTTSSTGRINNSASCVPQSGQVNSSFRATPRFSSSKPGQSLSNSVTCNPTGSGFQPRTPSPVCSYPANRLGTQYPQRGSTSMRAGTPGYTSSLPNSHGRCTPQGTSSIRQTLNCSTSNSTPRQFSTPAQRFSNSSTPNHQSRTQGDRPFTTHGARTQNRGPTGQTVTPQTPLLTSRVAQLFQTPTAGSTGPSRTRVRKFPGPAGVLPKLVQGQSLNNVKLPSPENDPETPGTSSDKPEELAASQDIGDMDFSHGAWQMMKTDLGLEEDDPNSILSKNNIALVLRKASLKQLIKNRVPHLCVLIKAITFNGDSSVVLRDPTGEMQGTIHKRLVEEHQGELKPGSVLVLRQVGVLSPSLRNHYLNITPSNLVQVYPSESSTLSQSRQRTPKSRTPRSSRRSSGDALLLDADLNTPKKSGSLEPSRKFGRNALSQRMDQDGLKTSKSSEKERPESGDFLRRASSIRDKETLLDESLMQRPGCSKSNNLSESLGRRISELDGGDGRVIVPNRSEARLDQVTAHSDTDHSISGMSARLEGGATHSSKPHSRNDNNNSCPVVISDVSNGELNSKETLSNEKAPAKDEDFTELLADIGDDFFDDF